MIHDAALVVFSHLRWNFVYQRPQHLLSRLAANRQVVFVEEPIVNEQSEAHWQFSVPQDNVLVCKPQTPVNESGFSDPQMPHLKRLLRELLDQEQLGDHVAWFYTPMALPLLECLDPQAIVYDCMDELSTFLNAPKELLEREAELLHRCNLVLTGGPSLYRAKRDRHDNVHCFPSSVDASHFGQAKQDLVQPEDQANLGRPRLGYFGVIDERLDLALLNDVAQSHPEWEIVMVGPVVKISEADLPRQSNIHYIGQRDYKDLPSYVAGWDVCLLPFALNEATRYISPTKTLEYMAAERQIVSTPITDVAEPYGDIVYLGQTSGAFVQACELALDAPDWDRAQRVLGMRKVLANTSWDSTAAEIEKLLNKAIHAGGVGQPPVTDRHRLHEGFSAPAQQSNSSTLPSQSWRSDSADTPPVVVIGAGPTGLSAAFHLGEDALLLEQNNEVGGWCRSLELDGFTFDYAGHIMFSNDPYVHEMYKMLLGDNVHWQDREAWIYSKNVHTRYPFQGSLYGLPPQVIKECVMGAIEARFGDTKNAAAPEPSHNGNGHSHSANGNGKASDGQAHRNGKAIEDCCADGVMESTAKLASSNGHTNGCSHEPRNFEEFIYKVWGAGIAKHFAIPYNKKLWAVPLSEMETSWLGGRVPMPDLEEMLEGALQPAPKPMGPNARFGYPLRGGFQSLMNGFIPFVEEQLRLESGVAAVSPSARTVTLRDGSVLPYEYLISTMPLPVLIRSMGDEVPADVKAAASALRYVSVRCVHLGIGRENLTEKHWIYYPEQTVFHRIFVQGNASPHCNPPGGFGLTCEITYSEHKPLPCDGDALIERCVDDCQEVGLFTAADPVLTATQVDLPYAYVVYDHARPKHVALIRKWLEAQNVLLAGRYSEWEYYNSDHAFIAGKRAAEKVRELRAQAVETIKVGLPVAT